MISVPMIAEGITGIPMRTAGEVVGFGDEGYPAIQRKRHEEAVRKRRTIGRDDRCARIWDMMRAFGDRQKDLVMTSPKEHVLQDSQQHEDQQAGDLEARPGL